MQRTIFLVIITCCVIVCNCLDGTSSEAVLENILPEAKEIVVGAIGVVNNTNCCITVGLYPEENPAFETLTRQYHNGNLSKVELGKKVLEMIQTPANVDRTIAIRLSGSRANYSTVLPILADRINGSYYTPLQDMLTDARNRPINVNCSTRTGEVLLQSGSVHKSIVSEHSQRSKLVCAALITTLLEMDGSSLQIQFRSERLVPHHCQTDIKQQYRLRCLDRNCRLTHSDGAILNISNPRPVSLFQLGKNVANAIAFDVCCVDENQQEADFNCLQKRFSSDTVQLTYNGNERDGNVLQFYLQV